MDRQIPWNNLPTSPAITTNTNIAYIDLTSEPNSPDINTCTSMGPTSVWPSSLPINPDPQSTNPHPFQNLNLHPNSSQTIPWNNLPTSPAITTNTNIAYIDRTSEPNSPDINTCTSMGPTSVWPSSLPINPDPQSTNPHPFQNLNLHPNSSQTDTMTSVNSQVLSRKRKEVDQGEGSSNRNVNVNTALRIGPFEESSNRNCRVRINPTDQQHVPLNNHSVMNLESNNHNHNHFVPLNLSMNNNANNAASFNPHITRVMPQTTHHFLNHSSLTHSSMGNFVRVPQQVPAPLQLGSGQNIASVPARSFGSLSATWREGRLRRVADVISGIRESYVTRPEISVRPESPESGIRPDFSTRESRRRVLAEHFRTALARGGEHMNLENFRNAVAHRGHMTLEIQFPSHVILQRRTAELHDRHRDMRLDVDNMSYEELLALEEKIGDVNTGLDEEKIMKCLKQRKYISLSEESFSDEPCCICQEAYVEEEDVGRLKCGHDFHTACIKKWLILKNMCPICKTSVLAS